MDAFETYAMNANDMNAFLNAQASYSLRNAALSEWLTHSEVDVNAAVYVELGDRDFERSDNTMPLEDFVGELRALAANAPDGSEVVIELGTGGCTDDEHATYEVGYFRDPTPEERAEREETNRKIRERDKLRASEEAEKERAEFERLKAKFGPQA